MGRRKGAVRRSLRGFTCSNSNIVAERATQVANDLCLDLQTVEVTADTEGVGDLYRAVDDLRRRLDLLVKRET